MRELSGLNLGTKLTSSSQLSGKVVPEARSGASGVISVPTATFVLPVQVGELIAARVVKTLPDNKAVIEISGKTLVAETKVPLMEGQEMLLEARGLQEGKVLLQLLAVGKNPNTGSGQQAQFAQLLAQAGLTLNQENLQIVQYLMAEKAQITGPLLKEIARSLQNLRKSDGETIRAAVFLAVRGLPINAENIKLAGLILREGGSLGSSLGRILAQFQALDFANGTGSSQTPTPLIGGQVIDSEGANPRQGVSSQRAGINASSFENNKLQLTKVTGALNFGVNNNTTISIHISAANANSNQASGTNTGTTANTSTAPASDTNAGIAANTSTNPASYTNEAIILPSYNREAPVNNGFQAALKGSWEPVDPRTGPLNELPGQSPPITGTGEAAGGPENPDIKRFLVAVLKSLLTLDLGKNGQDGAQLAPETMAAQLKLTGETWQAKALLGKILAGISTSPQSLEDSLFPEVFPRQEALQQAEITIPEQVSKESGARKQQEDLKIRLQEPQFARMPVRLPEQAVNQEQVRPGFSRVFTPGTEQLRDILSARELLQVAYQKSDDGFIGYFPLPVQAEDGFIGADLYLWRKKAKENGPDTEESPGDHPGLGEGGFHVLFLLTTTSLGSWRIDLVTRGENLSINMAVNLEDAGRLVKKRLGELKEKIETQGYKVNHLNCQIVPKEPAATNSPEHVLLKANGKLNEEGSGKVNSPSFAAGVDLRV